MYLAPAFGSSQNRKDKAEIFKFSPVVHLEVIQMGTVNGDGQTVTEISNSTTTVTGNNDTINSAAGANHVAVIVTGNSDTVNLNPSSSSSVNLNGGSGNTVNSSGNIITMN